MCARFDTATGATASTSFNAAFCLSSTPVTSLRPTTSVWMLLPLVLMKPAMSDKQKAALNEVLAVAPVAVSNLAHTYNPVSGTLDTRDNLGGAQNPLDPAVLCSALASTGQLAKLPVTGTIVQTCQAIAKTLGGLPVIGGGITSGGGLVGLPPLPGLGG